VQGHAGIPLIDLGIIVVVLATIAALGTIIVKKRSSIRAMVMRLKPIES
jgi:hypothetical protein